MSNMLKKIAFYTAGALSGVALSVSLQSLANDTDSKPLPIESLRTMAEVYSHIKERYVHEESDSKLLEHATKGMINGLDPHSEYLDKKRLSELQEDTSGEFGGLGMEISQNKNGFVKVVAPIEGTPAERAGVQSGDLIVKINDESTRDMSVTEAVNKMRGAPNTKITLTLARNNVAKPIVLHLTRAIIKVHSVRHHLLENDYGYVRISSFQERTIENMVDSIIALNQQNQSPLKGIVLDLRDDPGGLLNAAVGVSAIFLPPNELVVSTKGRNETIKQEYRATPQHYSLHASDPLSRLPENIKTIPITVLINSGSASASEIVTGALQDHKRAVVVGTRSFGKGSVQEVVPLSNGGAIKITSSLYYTPNNRSIQATGIEPDVEVKDKNRTFEYREADFSRHISNPSGAQEVKGGTIETLPEDTIATSETQAKDKPIDDEESIALARTPNPEKDEQLRKALDLLKNPTEWEKYLGWVNNPARPKSTPRPNADE